MLRIDEIVVPESIADHYQASQPFNSLSGVKRLNVIVGPNNSGKSRLLRSLFLENKQLQVSTNTPRASAVRELIRSISAKSPKKDGIPHFDDRIDDLETLIYQDKLGFHGITQPISQTATIQQKHQLLAQEIENLGRRRSSHSEEEEAEILSIPSELQQLQIELGRLEREFKKLESKNGSPAQVFSETEFVYIPTLRGMRLGTDAEDLRHAYFDRTWTDYIKPTDKHTSPGEKQLELARIFYSGKTVVTGLDFYDYLTSKLLGSLEDRKFIRSYEAYLSKTFFSDKPVALIPRRGHDTVNIKIGSEAEKPIQKLGDGLQQVIILTLPMFERQSKPLMLLIEEPDLFLHPGYQRVFIDAIFANRNPNLYVFVTTHSGQFLDATISEEDCSIFRCTKVPGEEEQDDEHEPHFQVTNATTGDHELLKHVGIRPSSVMFANCTIWVEGITDRLYYGRFLELLLKKSGHRLIENLHYAFVEYGGGNITHWSFLDEKEGMDVERICARLFLITDKDDGKEARHEKLGSVLGKHFCRLSVREVENLLLPETIKAVIADYDGDSIALNQFNYSAYGSLYLGEFIDDKVLTDKKTSKRYSEKTETAYAASSGTVKDKVRFCRKALVHLNSVSDLSEEAKTVAEKLLAFVLEENS